MTPGNDFNVAIRVETEFDFSTRVTCEYRRVGSDVDSGPEDLDVSPKLSEKVCSTAFADGAETSEKM